MEPRTLAGITELCLNASLAIRTCQKQIKRFLIMQLLDMKKYQICLYNLEELSLHTCTYQCDSLEEFISNIASIWMYFRESDIFLSFLFNTSRKQWCWITKNDDQKHKGYTIMLQRAMFLPCERIYPRSTSNRSNRRNSCKWNVVGSFQPLS